MTDTEMEFLIMLGVLWVVFGILNAYWYKKKGGSAIQGFILSALLSPIIAALIIAVSKPDKKALDQAAVASGEFKKCPACAELIKNAATKCRFCGEQL